MAFRNLQFDLFDFYMKQPTFLKRDDTIAIVSAARKISLPEIQPAIELLKEWDYKLKLVKLLALKNISLPELTNNVGQI